MNHQQATARRAWQAARQPGAGLEHIDMRLLRPEDGAQTDIGELLAVVRRSARGLALWVLLCLGLAGTYLVTARPEFVATTQVVLEPRQQVAAGTDPNPPDFGPTLDSAQADSQIQVIKSERNLRFAFDTLSIAADPLYKPDPPGLLQRVVALLPQLSSAPPLSPEEQAQKALDLAFQSFTDRVTARRLGQSYVLEVSFRAPTPHEAARLANAITAAYIRDQVLFKAASVQRGTEFLQGRIADIKAEQEVATDSVKKGVIPDFQFADSDARVVSAALEPLTKAYPQTTLILLLALVFSLLSGVGTIIVRHSLDRTIRSREQIGRILGVDCLGVLPRLRGGFGKRRERKELSYRTVLEQPDSAFAQTLRVLRTALFAGGEEPRRVSVGFVSCAPGEGRSAVAANLAFLLAASHDRVVLMDGDFRNPALTRALAPDAALGMSEVLLSRVPQRLPEVALSQDLAFLPAVGAGRQSDPNVFIGSKEMLAILDTLRSERDIILDLPPLSVSADAQAVGHLLDGVILLAVVNKTTLDQLSEAIRALHAGNVRVFGIVLNN